MCHSLRWGVEDCESPPSSGRIMGRCRQHGPREARVTSSLLAGVSRSPHKSGSSLASHRLRPVAAGARASQAASPALAPLALRHQAQPTASVLKLRTHGPPRFASRPVLQPPPRRPTTPRMSHARPRRASPPTAPVMPHADAARPPTHGLDCCAPFFRFAHSLSRPPVTCGLRPQGS